MSHREKCNYISRQRTVACTALTITGISNGSHTLGKTSVALQFANILCRYLVKTGCGVVSVDSHWHNVVDLIYMLKNSSRLCLLSAACLEHKMILIHHFDQTEKTHQRFFTVYHTEFNFFITRTRHINISVNVPVLPSWKMFSMYFT